MLCLISFGFGLAAEIRVLGGHLIESLASMTLSVDRGRHAREAGSLQPGAGGGEEVAQAGLKESASLGCECTAESLGV